MGSCGQSRDADHFDAVNLAHAFVGLPDGGHVLLQALGTHEGGGHLQGVSVAGGVKVGPVDFVEHD